MPPLEVAVAGAGVTGLAMALALARDGHRVTLIERDTVAVGDPQDSMTWERRGIPHFLQAHAFTSRGRLELKTLFPDVFDSLIAAGADDLDLAAKAPGAAAPGDEDLRMLGVRRPLIEWALRRAVVAEPGVRILSGVAVTGLLAAAGDQPTVTGLRSEEGSLEADLVIDAMGRRSPVPTWIAALGGTPMAETSSECGVIYYTRYFRVRPGRILPDGPWLPAPRADLGYGLFSTFPGDNGTFAALIAIAPGDAELKLLRRSAAFDAAASLMPALWSWVNPDTAEPLTDVLPMGSLQNTLRTPVDDRPPTIGLISVGDAVCHTDPVFALGLSFGLVAAGRLVAALREHGADIEAAALAFDGAMRPELTERFDFAVATDDLRLRRWTGEPFDIAHHDGGAYPLFIAAAGGAVAVTDRSVLRAVVRRNYFLDPLRVLDDDMALRALIEQRFAELMAIPRPRPGPSRDELLEAMRQALA